MAQITVHGGQWAVVRQDGTVVAVHGEGRHVLPRRGWRQTQEVTRVDGRRSLLMLSGQEVACADVPGIRVSVALTWQVGDPVAFLDVASDPVEHVRLAAQIALRDAVARRTLAALTAGRQELGDELLGAVVVAGREVGVSVLKVDLRDVSPPGEVRRGMLAVQLAQQEGLAALERARAETAALRAMANGARVLAAHPALLQLRTAEAVAAGGGTVVLGQTVAPSPTW